MRFDSKRVILGNEAQDSDLATRGTRLQGQNYNAAQTLNLGRRPQDAHRGTVLPLGEPPPDRVPPPPAPRLDRAPTLEEMRLHPLRYRPRTQP